MKEDLEKIQEHIDNVLQETKVKETGWMILKSIYLFVLNIILFIKECFVWLSYARLKIPKVGFAIELAAFIVLGLYPMMYFYTEYRVTQDTTSVRMFQIEDSMKQEVLKAEGAGWLRGKKSVLDSLRVAKEKAIEEERAKARAREAAWKAKMAAEAQQQGE